MVKESIVKPTVFLSASIPLPGRDTRFIATADNVAIRDSIKALISVAIPTYRLVFGGHPAITPLIDLLAPKSDRSELIVYQTEYFQGGFPSELIKFINVRETPVRNDSAKDSLEFMREEMISSYDFESAIFIGGMEGVEQEFEIFRKTHPTKPCYPIASTGAAALLIYERFCPESHNLLNNLRYLSLFRSLLPSIDQADD